MDEAIPPAIADRGFEFGQALYGSAAFVVRHLACALPGFQTSNVLINPNNVVVQAVRRTMLDEGDYCFCALQLQGQVTASRADIGHDDLAVLRPNRARLQASTTTEAHYQQAVTAFAAHPDPPGRLLQWVCRDEMTAVDLTANRMTLTPASWPCVRKKDRFGDPHKEGLVEERPNEPLPLHLRVGSDMLRRSTNSLEKA